MGVFERYLSLWVALALGFGLLLGQSLPMPFAQLANWQYAGVNIPIAVCIWIMIYPMLVQIQWKSLGSSLRQPQGLALTVVMNWLVKPFTMAAIGWLFFRVIFEPWIDPDTATEYLAGVILLGVAPCTAMVFVWSHLVRGDANYTLMQVAVNDFILIFAFAPLAGILLGLNHIQVPWLTLLASVGLYVVLPLIAALITQKMLPDAHQRAAWLSRCKPLSMAGLLLTVLLLFAIQAPEVLAKPIPIVLIAVPLLLQTYGIFALSYAIAWKLKLPHAIAAPACLISTSNFFELAVAVAIGLFGVHSGAALATVVGVLVEVPVMLSLVAFANRSRHHFA
jgi:arsenite transporter